MGVEPLMQQILHYTNSHMSTIPYMLPDFLQEQKIRKTLAFELFIWAFDILFILDLGSRKQFLTFSPKTDQDRNQQMRAPPVFLRAPYLEKPFAWEPLAQTLILSTA